MKKFENRWQIWQNYGHEFGASLFWPILYTRVLLRVVIHSRREPMNSRNHARVRRATNDKLYLRRRWYQRIPDARHWSVRRTQRGPVSAVPAPPCRLPSPASVSRDRRESPEAVAHSAAPSTCSSASELPASHNTRNAATVNIRSNWSDTESWIAPL